jgi:hypothetical protein
MGGSALYWYYGGVALLADYPLRGGLVFGWLILMCALAIPYVVAGIGLLQLRPWARSLGIVLLTLSLFNAPVGTALGIYGLWVLLSPEADEVFSPRFQR